MPKQPKTNGKDAARALALAAERERNLSFMQTPDEWPCWPVLPLKRYTGTWPECALFFYTRDDKGVVQGRLAVGAILGIATDEQMQNALVLAPAEIVAQGWVVD